VVLYKDTAVDGTSPIIAADTLPADVISTNGTWTYQIAPLGFAIFFGD
jgi:hypothetical protein